MRSSHGSIVLREFRLLKVAVTGWHSCLPSWFLLLCGASYLFVPLDLIPDRIPVIGHLDEAGFLLGGLLAARYFLPATIRQAGLPAPARLPLNPTAWQTVQFALRVLQADLANFSLFHHRAVDGFLVTGKNSGTHWLKFMLSCAIAEHFGVPAPLHSSGRDADAIISHPRWPSRYPHLPRIGSSHTVPSVAFGWRFLAALLPHPPVVVLVRDIRTAMVSNYVKWQPQYGVRFSAYVRGDPRGRRYIADLWWYIHFFNRWGDVALARPHDVLVVRYEDLLADTSGHLRQIATHLRLPMDERTLAVALDVADRDALRSHLDPEDADLIMPSAEAKAAVNFSAADQAFMRQVFHRYLRHDFGYGYRDPA
jgi:sulfotransferase family protein/uncharacterized protein DUF1232